MDNIDVVMATYNGAPFVAQQIESILAQNVPHVRLLVRDDGSTDGTCAVLAQWAERHPGRIVLLPSTEGTLGVNGNFSHLMAQTTAPYVMFADQDDVWLPGKISRTLARMQEAERHSRVVLVHTDLAVVDETLKIIAPSFWRYAHLTPSEGETLNRLLVQPLVTGCTVMVNRPLLERALPIPPSCVMYDAWLALVAAAFGRVDLLPERTVLYRQHQHNVLGANKFWSLSYWLHKRKTIASNEAKKYRQGEELLRRYSEQLPPKIRELAAAYTSMARAALPERCLTTLKYRLFRCGLTRNLFSFIIKI